MDKLVDWVKANAKEGVNVSDFEALAKGRVMPELADKDAAIKFARSHPVLNSALDASIMAAVQTHDSKFTAEKLPEIEKGLREKLMLELNPKETPEQKKIRELSEALDGMKRKDAETALKDALRAKAKEIGYDVTLADRFAVYGDKASDMMLAEHELLQAKIKEQVEAEIKRRYGDIKQPSSGKPDQSNTKPRAEIDAMSPMDKRNFFLSGGKYAKES